MAKPLIKGKFILEKYPGKGGWTYAVLPGVENKSKSQFRWVRVKGKIDGYEIKNYNLMPVKGGKLFLPVKADIRKIIGKQEGDYINVEFYYDDTQVEIPGELLECLKNEPGALETFLSYPAGEQRGFINWILEAKTESTKVKRLTETLRKLSLRQRFYERFDSKL